MSEDSRLVDVLGAHLRPHETGMSGISQDPGVVRRHLPRKIPHVKDLREF